MKQMPTIAAGFIGGLLVFGAFFVASDSRVSSLVSLGSAGDPSTLSAQAISGGLVPCGNPGQPPCQACHLVTLGKNLLNFGVYMTVFIAAVMFSWGGFYYFTSAGSEESIKKAHKIFANTFIGMAFVLLAWVIVDTIMKALFTGSALSQRYGPWYQIRCAPASPQRGNQNTPGAITASPSSDTRRCAGLGTDPNCIYEESLIKTEAEVRGELDEAIQRDILQRQEEERARLEAERSE